MLTCIVSKARSLKTGYDEQSCDQFGSKLACPDQPVMSLLNYYVYPENATISDTHGTYVGKLINAAIY